VTDPFDFETATKNSTFQREGNSSLCSRGVQ